MDSITPPKHTPPTLLGCCEGLLEWFTVFRDDLIEDRYGEDAIDGFIADLRVAVSDAGGKLYDDR